MPLWFGHINKRIFNPLEIRKGKRPVLTHIGRTTGATFKTPLDAVPVEKGYVFVLMYGSDCDWVKNVLTAGRATLRIDDEDVQLARPRIETSEQAWARLPATFKRPPKFFAVSELLRMDAV